MRSFQWFTELTTRERHTPIVVQGISTGPAMSMGSGRVVADLIARRPPEIDLDGLTLDRYRRR